MNLQLMYTRGMRKSNPIKRIRKLGGKTAESRARRAISNITLESLKPSPTATHCIHKMAEGKMSANEAVNKISALYAR